ncbi:MAG: flagellar basal body P-ring protein FlgI, partial [Planctomycetales bacterium]|nr:flagellar basal body P-ring protein FlgI [Planctomycetales bacterium]
GCHNKPVVRSQNPDDSILAEREVQTVGDITAPVGLRAVRAEGLTLVNSLRATGSDPPPNSQRTMVIEDMKRRSIENPNEILASPNTSIVVVRGIIPPGAQKGDRIDVEVTVPRRSGTTSLEGGWMLQARLLETAYLGNQLRTGRTLAYAEGSIMTDSQIEGETSEVAQVHGRVIGGGVVNTDRSLGLALRSDRHMGIYSIKVSDAINRRFHHFDRGSKKGAATPKTDKYIELAVQPHYRNNLLRYLRVVQLVPLREYTAELPDQLERLGNELRAMETSQMAALELEAIGDQAAPTLRSGLEASEPLIRFYSAEALAYLNDATAVPYLKEAIETEPAFRWNGLTALAAMIDVDAHEALSELMHSESAETRYGAFDALREANPRNPTVQGQVLGDILVMHHVPSDQEPMVHVRRQGRPEMVMFGSQVQLQAPFALFAGHDIMVKSDGDKVKVIRFHVSPDRGDQVRYCRFDLQEIVKAMVELGGSYADVITVIMEAKEKGCFGGRVVFDALPKSGRQYTPEIADEADEPFESEDDAVDQNVTDAA